MLSSCCSEPDHVCFYCSFAESVVLASEEFSLFQSSIVFAALMLVLYNCLHRQFI